MHRCSMADPRAPMPLFLRLADGFDWHSGSGLDDVVARYCDRAMDRFLCDAVADPATAALLPGLSHLSGERRARLMLDPRVLRAAAAGDAATLAGLIAADPGGDRIGQGAIALVVEGPDDPEARVLIDAALALLTDRHPPAARFVTACTALVRVRRDHRPFYSSSPERMIGATILWNLSTPGVTVEMVAEALVHEAIHSLLDMDSGLRADGDAPGGAWMPAAMLADGTSRTVSPWTGAPLSVAIFVHACVVWYALFTLWRDLLSGGAGIDRAEAVRLLRRATAGFFDRPEDQLARFADVLAPDLIPGIAALGSRVRMALAEAA